MDPSLSSGTYLHIRNTWQYRSPHESHNSHKLGYMRYTRDQAHTLYLPFHSLFTYLRSESGLMKVRGIKPTLPAS